MRKSRMETEASLGLWERETIINYNEAESVAYIYTHNRALISHLEKKLGLKPTAKNSHGGKDYELTKKWLRKPQNPPKKTEAQMQASRDVMTRLQAKKRAGVNKQNQFCGEKTPKDTTNQTPKKSSASRRSRNFFRGT